MSTTDQKRAPGGHYSGRNPVPNIQRFIESLDAEKKNRDAQLEAEMKANRSNGEVKDHVESQPKGVKGTRKTVTDPTTGNQVQIENVNAHFMKAAEHPVVCRKYPFLFILNCPNNFPALCAECERGERNCKSLRDGMSDQVLHAN